MNEIRKILLLNTLLFGLAACTYDVENELWCTNPPEAVLPDSVGVGESVLYLNGQKVAWVPKVVLNGGTVLSYEFSTYDPVSTIENGVSFIRVPLHTGNFEMISLEDFANLLNSGGTLADDVIVTAFGNYISGTDEAYIYRSVDMDQSFFQVESFDTLHRQARARFKTKFCLEDRNGYLGIYLPTTLLFQGVINESY